MLVYRGLKLFEHWYNFFKLKPLQPYENSEKFCSYHCSLNLLIFENLGFKNADFSSGVQVIKISPVHFKKVFFQEKKLNLEH